MLDSGQDVLVCFASMLHKGCFVCESNLSMFFSPGYFTGVVSHIDRVSVVKLGLAAALYFKFALP